MVQDRGNGARTADNIHASPLGDRAASLSFRPARLGRNPKSGERVQVAAKYVPHFKAGKELRDRVDFPL